LYLEIRRDNNTGCSLRYQELPWQGNEGGYDRETWKIIQREKKRANIYEIEL